MFDIKFKVDHCNTKHMHNMPSHNLDKSHLLSNNTITKISNPILHSDICCHPQQSPAASNSYLSHNLTPACIHNQPISKDEHSQRLGWSEQVIGHICKCSMSETNSIASITMIGNGH